MGALKNLVTDLELSKEAVETILIENDIWIDEMEAKGWVDGERLEALRRAYDEFEDRRTELGILMAYAEMYELHKEIDKNFNKMCECVKGEKDD